MADPDLPVAVVLLDETGPPETVVADGLADVRHTTESELAAALPGAEILFVLNFRSTALRSAWPHADALRWVHHAGAGVDKLLFPELVASQVTVTNSRGVFDQPIAEYVLGLVLTFAKGLHTTVGLQQRRQWQHRETERLTGARALVVGTGPIGRATGRLLAAAGLVVSGVGRVDHPADPDLGDIRAFDQLSQALAEADYVVLAAPLTDTTRHMIDRTALAAMKPTARLINVGRGQLVVDADLLAALAEQRIAGAALDVFADEPLPQSSPWWDAPNAIISPHMSGDVIGWRTELIELFLANLARYRRGAALRNVVDKNLGYVPSAPLAGSTGAP
ncbi:MAG TPA: D-2-hydroxyacid dehydrogenase [Pseudonocardiaceae bacterium]|jgi:phosphoglycerate dehydrogenase-like enzyme|nr:D-2-hydroxyacid dehydrogenase [Pseudonocardiaceae bacterium]